MKEYCDWVRDGEQTNATTNRNKENILPHMIWGRRRRVRLEKKKQRKFKSQCERKNIAVCDACYVCMFMLLFYIGMFFVARCTPSDRASSTHYFRFLRVFVSYVFLLFQTPIGPSLLFFFWSQHLSYEVVCIKRGYWAYGYMNGWMKWIRPKPKFVSE